MAGSHSKRNSVRATDAAPTNSSADPAKNSSCGRISEVSPSYCRTTAISQYPIRIARTRSALPQLRHWTVGYRHRYVEHHHPYIQHRPDPPPVPFLPLQGRWLHHAGFAIGTPVRVLVTPGRLVLEVDEVEREAQA